MGQPLREDQTRQPQLQPQPAPARVAQPAPRDSAVGGERRRILIYGDATLRRISAPVAEVDDGVRRLVESLLATMYAAPGIGLAAPQIGELRRVIVVDPSRNDESGRRLALINPEIREFDGLTEYEEGCLSVPGIYAEVRRPERILVRYLDPDGRQREEEYRGVMARVIQHEHDHLEGKLFVDHLSRMRRTLLMKKLRELEERSRKG